MKLVLSVLILVGLSLNVFAEEKKRVPAADNNVIVTRINGSQNYTTEKWVDKDNKVVCYAGQGSGQDAGFGIACVKLDTTPQ